MFRGFLFRLQAQTGKYDARVKPAIADTDPFTNLLRVSLFVFTDDSMTLYRFKFQPSVAITFQLNYLPVLHLPSINLPSN